MPQDLQVRWGDMEPMSAQWVTSLSLRQVSIGLLCAMAAAWKNPYRIPLLWAASLWSGLQAVDEVVGGNFFGMGQIVELCALTVGMVAIAATSKWHPKHKPSTTPD